MKNFNGTLTAMALALLAGSAQAQVSGDVVRIGVLTEFAGVYSHLAGKGSVEAVKMAVKDFGGTVLGKPIEVVEADHQNQADLGAAKAREWFDVGGVDMITEFNNSGVAGGQSDRGRKTQDRHRQRILRSGAHQRGLHAVHDPLCL